MIYLKIILRDDKVDNWIKQEHVKVSTILMILKKNFGFKNMMEVMKQTHLDSGLLRTKVCWKTEDEFSNITTLLNDIISSSRNRFIYGTRLLDYTVKGGSLSLVFDYTEEPVTLRYWTIERTIVRWIKERFY